MREPDKIRAQLLRPSEQRLRVCAAVSTSTAKRRLFVNAHAAQKDRFSVQQNLRAARLDTAKSDLIAHLIRRGFNRDVVKLWTLRRPQPQRRGEID
jgi:hypothetical protein